MKLFVLVILSISLQTMAAVQHKVISKITDEYARNADGEFILQKSTYNVGTMRDNDGSINKVKSKNKVINYKKSKLTENSKKADQVLKISKSMTGKSFKGVEPKLSDESCTIHASEKICVSSLEITQ